MKVKWLGHASFLITSDAGVKIITDPYKTGGDLLYGEIKESADIVTVSHDHFDHNYVAAVKGNPEIIREPVAVVEIKGIKLYGIPTYHDDAKGSKRGNNTIFCFEVDGIRVCHLGDLGHLLSDKTTAEIGRVDLLFIPVGGFYTIDARVATKVSQQLKPKIVIPMHYKNERCTLPISSVDNFLQGKESVSKLGGSEVIFNQGELPATTRIVVLKPLL